MNKSLNMILDIVCNDKKYTLILPYPETTKHVFEALQKFSDEMTIWEKEILAEEEKRKQEASGPIEIAAEPVADQPS